MVKQLIDEVFGSLHGEIGKHRGITKTKIAHRGKHYFPKMVQLIKEWAMSFEQGIKETPIDRCLTRSPL